MVPTFRTWLIAYWCWKTRDVSVGDVVAIEDPQAPQRVLVKRVVGIDRSVVRVRETMPARAGDSRHFGPVPRRRSSGGSSLATLTSRYYARATLEQRVRAGQKHERYS